MDKEVLKIKIDEAYLTGSRSDLYKNLNIEDIRTVIDLLFEKIKNSDKHLEELEDLKERIKTLNNKSGQIVRCLRIVPGRRAVVQFGPIKEEVMISPSVDITKIKTGTEVLIIGSPEGRLISDIRDNKILDGRVCKIQRMINNMAIIEDGGSSIVLNLIDGLECKEGDEVRYDLGSQLILEVLSSTNENKFVLSSSPKETFNDVKGLDEEKKLLYERIIYPSIYKEKHEKYGIKPIKGAMLYGPSGCGKSMIAGAIFNEMIRLKQKRSATLKEKTNYNGFFLINGPSVLSKWVGDTELTIRKIFADARNASELSGVPSIIFWDEIDSIAGKRKDISTYSPEKTIVPTLLAELQGVEKDNNVILICATNKPELIDQALMRPGRLGDLILEIPRPCALAAKRIISSKFNKEVPPNLKELLNDGLVDKIVEHIYNNELPLITARNKSGQTIDILRANMINGALFSNLSEELVRRTFLIEIQELDDIKIPDVLKIIDDILLRQLGAVNTGAKVGFDIDISDLTMDISLND